MWPMTLDNHDVWLDLESHKRCYIARSTNRLKQISCVEKGSWLFLNVWSDKQSAVEFLNKAGEGPDDYELSEIACAELFSIYRAVNYDGVLQLVTGATSTVTVSTTYVPTQRLVTDPTVVWMYATHNDERVTIKNALVVALAPQLLMGELFEHSNVFEEEYVLGHYKFHCCTLMELIQLTDDVYTDMHVYNLKHEMRTSKVMHQMMVEKKEGKNV